ncbi:MAG TPA: alkaline phosphatase family protein [Terriglobales bacterium]|jgi:predicted AlkP superfamily pyrophosphatase or phosphodiesterase|nr:alkaline phosphatase family protein [Terriglobales bacterium]
MRSPLRPAVLALLVCLSALSYGSAYNARPKLVVVIVVDQFRGDYLERYRDQFGEGGFRLLLDHGAYFTDCNYDYANTRTAPGHATLFTGTYSSGHGILANEWWDPGKKRLVTSVEDDATKLVGVPRNAPGASPHNLLADTLGDELKLATHGQARVFGVALKDRAAILPAGFAGDGAYWMDHKTGKWVTSTYYRSQLPKWAQDFNDSGRAEKYLNKEWKDASGNTLRTTAPRTSKDGTPAGFYDLVAPTPFANDYTFDFARELVTYERLGNGPATDLLVIGLSANDIVGHEAGPGSPQVEAMTLATDRQLADFFAFLGHQVGLANVWIALSADHGIAPLPSVAAGLRIPAAGLSPEKMRGELNRLLSAKLSPGHPAEYVKDFDYPLAWLGQDAFAAIRMKEADAERAVGDALKQIGLRGYYTRYDLSEGEVPNSEQGHKYEHSYSPLGGWYVMGVPAPFTVGVTTGTDHASPYTYDTHVPLAFYGLAFQPGTYRKHAEPVDLAVTLASLLGINAPTHAIGRVLTEALAPAHRVENSSRPPDVKAPQRSPSTDEVKPVSLSGLRGGPQ